MADPYLAEIRIFPFGFAPRGWALCNGASLPIAQNQALYSLISITYGGDGKTSFNLPDLRGRVPVHVSAATSWKVEEGKTYGAQIVQLVSSQMPAHVHVVNGENSLGNSVNPLTKAGATIWSTPATSTAPVEPIAVNPFSNATVNAQMDPTVISIAGEGGSHENMQPYLALNYCIAIVGMYPVRP